MAPTYCRRTAAPDPRSAEPTAGESRRAGVRSRPIRRVRPGIRHRRRGAADRDDLGHRRARRSNLHGATGSADGRGAAGVPDRRLRAWIRAVDEPTPIDARRAGRARLYRDRPGQRGFVLPRPRPIRRGSDPRDPLGSGHPAERTRHPRRRRRAFDGRRSRASCGRCGSGYRVDRDPGRRRDAPVRHGRRCRDHRTGPFRRGLTGPNRGPGHHSRHVRRQARCGGVGVDQRRVPLWFIDRTAFLGLGCDSGSISRSTQLLTAKLLGDWLDSTLKGAAPQQIPAGVTVERR